MWMKLVDEIKAKLTQLDLRISQLEINNPSSPPKLAKIDFTTSPKTVEGFGAAPLVQDISDQATYDPTPSANAAEQDYVLIKENRSTVRYILSRLASENKAIVTQDFVSNANGLATKVEELSSQINFLNEQINLAPQLETEVQDLKDELRVLRDEKIRLIKREETMRGRAVAAEKDYNDLQLKYEDLKEAFDSINSGL